MKKLLLILPLLFTLKASAQKIIETDSVTDHSYHVVGDNFEGIVFKENYFHHPNDTSETKIKRFSPSKEDIILAETVLRANHKHKGKDAEYIFRHLNNYHRQYIGYFNENNEKMIYINCFPVDEDWANENIKKGSYIGMPKWYNDLFQVFDGGRSFWQVRIKLTTKEIVSLTINGLA